MRKTNKKLFLKYLGVHFVLAIYYQTWACTKVWFGYPMRLLGKTKFSFLFGYELGTVPGLDMETCVYFPLLETGPHLVRPV